MRETRFPEFLVERRSSLISSKLKSGATLQALVIIFFFFFALLTYITQARHISTHRSSKSELGYPGSNVMRSIR